MSVAHRKGDLSDDFKSKVQVAGALNSITQDTNAPEEYKKFSFAPATDAEFTKFIMLEVNRAKADGGTSSAYAVVSNALDYLNNAQNGRKNDEKSASFVRSLMLMQYLERLYGQIEINNKEIELIIEGLSEIDHVRRDLLDPNSSRSFEELQADTRKILEKFGYDADKVLAEAKTREDYVDILTKIENEKKQRMAELEKNNRELEQSAKEIAREVNKINADQNLTADQKENTIKEAIKNSSEKALWRIEEKVGSEPAGQAVKDELERRESLAKPSHQNTTLQGGFSLEAADGNPSRNLNPGF